MHRWVLTQSAFARFAPYFSSNHRLYRQVENPLLIGHSDGASIALIHAGAGHAVRGVVAMAPHVFIEPLCLNSIVTAAQAFETGDLGQKLGRHHRDARKTFYGWADVWLDPDFVSWYIRDAYLPGIECPVLVIRGEHALPPSRLIADMLLILVPSARLAVLRGAGHMGPLTHPADVNALIAGHLAEASDESDGAPSLVPADDFAA